MNWSICLFQRNHGLGDLIYSMMLIYPVVTADENDESLRRWKESLGIGSGKDISDPNDPRTVVILSLALEVEGRDDIVVDLQTPAALERLKHTPFTIKEGARYRMKVKFRVQRQVLSGMKYLQAIKRKGIRIAKEEEMIVRPVYPKSC